jgi:hypothetical protein
MAGNIFTQIHNEAQAPPPSSGNVFAQIHAENTQQSRQSEEAGPSSIDFKPQPVAGSWWDRLKGTIRNTMGQLAEGQESEAQGNQQVAQQYIEQGPKEIYHGAEEIAGRAPGQTESQIAHGFNRMVSGAGVTAIPAAASAVPLALATAPVTTAATIGSGMLAQTGTEYGLKSVGVSPDTAEAAGNVAGFATSGAVEGGISKLSKVSHLPDIVTTAIDKNTPEFIQGPLRRVVQELTGSTPERVAELAHLENKVADAHGIAVKAEAAAKADAKAAFPEIQTPVELAPKYTKGGWQGDHFVTADELQPQKIDFRTAQEQYSQLAMDARAAHLARMRGMVTGFDEAAILAKKTALGSAMQTAAEADGKLPQYNAAKQGFMEFMNDFHNKGSAIEPLLEMKPDETSKIVNHFLHPDKGARALETLSKYGADIEAIQEMLSKGATPLKIDVNEAAKLRKVGQEGYGPLRLQESIDQATYNRLPSGAQARLPAAAMRRTTKLPLIPEAISPDIPTRFLTKSLLKSRLAKKAVGSSIASMMKR